MSNIFTTAAVTALALAAQGVQAAFGEDPTSTPSQTPTHSPIISTGSPTTNYPTSSPVANVTSGTGILTASPQALLLTAFAGVVAANPEILGQLAEAASSAASHAKEKVGSLFTDAKIAPVQTRQTERA